MDVSNVFFNQQVCFKCCFLMCVCVCESYILTLIFLSQFSPKRSVVVGGGCCCCFSEMHDSQSTTLVRDLFRNDM